MKTRWDYEEARKVLQTGIRDLLPKGCSILQQNFFLDIAVPRGEDDVLCGTMSTLEKTLITLSALCLQESYTLSGDGPIATEDGKDTFYLVDQALYKRRSCLSAMSIFFMDLLQLSLSRFISPDGSSLITSRENFEIVADERTLCCVAETPLRKIPSNESLEKILLDEILFGMSFGEITTDNFDLDSLPEDATIFGGMTEFETLTFVIATRMLEKSLDKTVEALERAASPLPTPLPQADKLEVALKANIFNILFARSIFARFPTIDEESFAIGDGFLIAECPGFSNEQPMVTLHEIPLEDEIPELPSTGSAPATPSVGANFDLQGWDPTKDRNGS